MGGLVREVIRQNMIVIMFAYGLAFFTMGLAIALQEKRASELYLARRLWLLTAFGLFHGFTEWGYIFIPIQSNYLGNSALEVMSLVHVFIQAVSFTFLLFFGALSVGDGLAASSSRPPLRWLPVLASLAALLWLAGFIFVRWVGRFDNTTWYIASDIWSRYLLAFPGALLTAGAMWLLRGSLGNLGFSAPRSVQRSLTGAGVTFLGYAVVGGVVVPPAHFFPASVLNTDMILDVLGIPVQVARAAAGLSMAYFIVRFLRVFNVEYAAKLSAVQRERTVLMERQRIARDIHDGILQGVYGAGLDLAAALRLAKSDPETAYGLVSGVAGRLNETMAELRHYLRELHSPNLREVRHGPLREELTRLALEYGRCHHLEVAVRFAGFLPAVLPTEVSSHLYYIVREALMNVARHAGTHKAWLDVKRTGDVLTCTVSDHGRGFIPGGADENCHGLQNMSARAAEMGATLTIDSEPGRGTSVRVVLRLDERRIPRFDSESRFNTEQGSAEK